METQNNIYLIIAVCALCTMLTRAIPFLIFGNRPVPKIITYLGRVLPPTIISTLVIFALRNTDIFASSHGLPELIGVLTAGIIHVFLKNAFASIGISTVLYMILIRIM